MSSIIDVHAHFEPRMLELASLLRKLDEQGVNKVALIPAMQDPIRSSNAILVAAVRPRSRRSLAIDGPMGYGMGLLQVQRFDGKGGLTFEDRPYVIMNDHA